MPTICLAMIVKNEAHVIERCLRSVLPHIDYVVISDTGSNDGTPAMAQHLCNEFDKCLILDITEWVDFSTNRNRVLALVDSSTDYVLTLDADEVFNLGDTPIIADTKGVSAFRLNVNYSGVVYDRVALFSPRDWHYEGVVHEVLMPNDPAKHLETRKLYGPSITVYHEGARSRDPLTYTRDALLLETALMTEMDSRNVFYCAQSWRDAGDKDRAIMWYRKRIEMGGGYYDEVRYSYYQIARLTNTIEDWLWACEKMAPRAEPVYWLGKWLNEHKLHQAARMVLADGCKLTPGPSDLFAEHDIYNYKMDMEYAVALHYCEYFSEAIYANEVLLEHANIPQAERELVGRNLAFSIAGLARSMGLGSDQDGA